MENNTILISNNYGSYTEYKQIENGKWTQRIDFGEWYDLKGNPPKKVLDQLNKKKQNTIAPKQNVPIPLKPIKTKKNMSDYQSFFIGNSEWYGNRFFASLPPSGPWIVQYIISQIIRDTSLTWKFRNAKMLKLLSDNHYLWANLSINNIVEKTGSSKNTVMRTLNESAERGCIIPVSGERTYIDNNIYICGVKSYTEYDSNNENQERLFVDSHYAAETGCIPDDILKVFVDELDNKRIAIDGRILASTLFN